MLLAASCTEREPLPSVDSLTTMDDAAHAAERSTGVPADLTLAVAWTETRWQTPPASDDGHVPSVVGVGALRPWLAGDRIDAAARELGVGTERLASDPVAGTLATALVLRDLAVARFGSVPAPDAAEWAAVIGDYAGIDDASARARYASDVLATLARGVRAVAATGETITLAPRTLALPEVAGTPEALGSADYGPAHWVAASSANYTTGRGGHAINCIVIHDMEGSYASAISWFANPASSVSAHYAIRSADGDITQMVHDRDTAWHAGNWDYNQRCIGIEHEGYASDPARWYTETMYEASATLVRHLCETYGIPEDRSHIIGHAEVPDPTHPGEFGGSGHHTDPGSGWNWSHYMDLVHGTPPVPAYAASYVRQSTPVDMTSGDRVVAWVEMRNDGSAVWSLTGTFLGTTMPRDHASPFFDRVNWVNDHRATAPDHTDYGMGATGRFTFMVTAPEVTTDTTITDHFGLVQEGVTWFGPADVTITIRVHPRAVPVADAGPPTTSDSGSVIPPTHDAGSASGDAGGSSWDGGGVGRPPPTFSGGCSVTGGGATGPAWLVLALLGLALARRARRFLPLIALAACTTSSTGTISGVVIDGLTHSPLAGAQIRIAGSETVATTDVTGHYTLSTHPGTLQMSAMASGHLAVTRGRVDVGSGVSGSEDFQVWPEHPSDAAVDQWLSARQAERDRLHDSPDDADLRPEARAILRGEQPIPTIAAGDVAGTRAALGAPPATIRIWRRAIDGSTASCSGRVDTIDLEEYVRGVLPHEWIASWDDESLRAGALAIRTYSWQWIAAGGKYTCADLDDTTASQVYRDDRNARASADVDATHGQAITAGGALVSGEYSAENGDPTAYGVADSVCAGHAVAGHGRGMCQWGSQRWALAGHDHVWIATHYYPGSIVEGGTPPTPTYAATYVGQSVPSDMTSGDSATAWVELRNDGTATWSAGGTFLGTTMPNDHASPFFDATNWVNDHRASPPDTDVATGATGRFTFTIIAPDVTSDTTVTDHFGLVQEGVTWFGPNDVTLTVNVHPRAAPPPPPPVDGGSTCSPSAEICGDGIDQDCNGADLPCPAHLPDGAVPASSDAGSGPSHDGGRPFGPTVHGGCSVAAGDAHGCLALFPLLAFFLGRRKKRKGLEA